MSREKVLLHPASQPTPEMVLLELNERHPAIQNIAVAYEYVSDGGELKTKVLFTGAEFLAQLADDFITESLAELD